MGHNISHNISHGIGNIGRNFGYVGHNIAQLGQGMLRFSGTRQSKFRNSRDSDGRFQEDSWELQDVRSKPPTPQKGTPVRSTPMHSPLQSRRYGGPSVCGMPPNGTYSPNMGMHPACLPSNGTHSPGMCVHPACMPLNGVHPAAMGMHPAACGMPPGLPPGMPPNCAHAPAAPAMSLYQAFRPMSITPRARNITPLRTPPLTPPQSRSQRLECGPAGAGNSFLIPTSLPPPVPGAPRSGHLPSDSRRTLSGDLSSDSRRSPSPRAVRSRISPAYDVALSRQVSDGASSSSISNTPGSRSRRTPRKPSDAPLSEATRDFSSGSSQWSGMRDREKRLEAARKAREQRRIERARDELRMKMMRACQAARTNGTEAAADPRVREQVPV